MIIINQLRRGFPLQALLILQPLLLLSVAQLNFPSSYVRIPEADMTFYFEYREENKTVLMGLDIDKNVDYFSIGYNDEGNYGMISFDYVAFIFIPNDQGDESEPSYKVNTMDLYSTKNSRPPEDTKIGGTNDYKLIDYYAVGQKRQVLFERAWDTKDKYDYVLNPEKTKFSVVFSWAWVQNGKHSFSYHGKTCGTVISQMYNGFQGDAKPYHPGILSPRLVLTIHGYVMLFGWLFLSEFALQIGRYKKTSKYYMAAHAWIMIFLYFITLVSVGFALYVKWGSIGGLASLIHYYLNWILVVLLTIQAAFGSILGIKIKREKKTAVIPSLTKFHFVLGIIVDIIIKIQTANGLYMFNPYYMTHLGVYYGFLLIVKGYQEYSYRYKSQIKGDAAIVEKRECQKNENHELLMTLLNNNTPISNILSIPKLKSLKWAILDDKVFEFNNFTHPGGNFILNFIIGHEIGRYIYGSHGLTTYPKGTQHSHSKDILKIIENNYIGSLQSNQQIIISKYHEIENSSVHGSLFDQNVNASLTSRVLQNSNRETLLPGNNSKPDWVLDSKVQLSTSISQFEFKCKNYVFKPFYTDISQIGKHMKLSHRSLAKIRLYTLVLSQTQARAQKREILWNRFITHSSESPTSYLNEDFPETLPLIIKKYDASKTTTFSKLLHDVPIGTEGFMIEGPFGFSLGLTSESIGSHYIFAAGTGVLPFLDLFDFLLEKTLESDGKIPSFFEKGFKLHVFASFVQTKDFVGLDICEKLLEVCKLKKLKDAFTLTIKASDATSTELYQVTDSFFDQEFVEKNVNKDCEKVYICGPPAFNNLIFSVAESMGLSSSKTILV